MSLTEAGAVLTEQHRVGQLRIRAQALRDYVRLWPVWDGDEDTFADLALAAVVLARAYHGMSATLAASYFTSFRLAELVKGEAAPRRAPALDEARVTAGLIITGQGTLREALSSGANPEVARERALVASSGSLGRQVLLGGRETILRSVEDDKEALGWSRVTDGDPCAFCALLAGRGPVYRESTVSFEAHDHCGCSAAPFYGGSWPGRAREFKDLYEEAIHQARQDGTMATGTSNDLLNTFRRYYDRQRGNTGG